MSGVTRELDINKRYTEIRPLNPIYDLPSIPATLFDVPGTLAKQVLLFYQAPELKSLIKWSDIILAEGPHLSSAISHLTSDSPVIYSSHNVEIDRWRDVSDSSVDEYFFERLVKNERDAVENCDAIICVSEADKQRYNELFSPSSPIIVIPNGTSSENVHSDFIQKGTERFRDYYGIDSDDRLVVFVGSDYGPNISAVEFIIQLSEKAKNENDPLHFLVAGNVCSHFDEQHSNLTLAGFVEDIDELYTAGDIALNPITEGAGSNIKLIEYLSNSVPTVTTPFGSRGFELSDGNEVFIRNLDQFYETILSLEEKQLQKISKNGRKKVREVYTWKKLSSLLLESLDDL
ncbi:glycosyltransferase family 4 protein [Haloferax gibbonsii]|uniref:glycosyltransferase family 4 protein n=1 Tax=Haloferax gibbonsii TaxID=35746 RepID=UPI00135F10FD|nr:glycosyltransferase family 4 protein [Haloferax gibbonsii]